MDEDSSAIAQLNAAFGTADIYAILKVEKSATANEISKAYKKLALKHHPDKGGDKTKFQALSLAHSILSDEEKRKVYDETGTLDENNTLSEQDFDFWYGYFRNLFPKVTIADIDKLQTQYVGSEEEKNDIIAAYDKYEGDFHKLMEVIMFAEEGEEERICDIIETAIITGALKETKLYKKTKAAHMKKISSKKRKKQSKEESKDAEEALIAAITKRHANQSSSLASSIAKKYGIDEGGDEDPLDDEAFAKMQAKVSAKYAKQSADKPAKQSKATKGTTSKKQK
jgi:DnaJ family protein C protein 9